MRYERGKFTLGDDEKSGAFESRESDEDSGDINVMRFLDLREDFDKGDRKDQILKEMRGLVDEFSDGEREKVAEYLSDELLAEFDLERHKIRVLDRKLGEEKDKSEKKRFREERERIWNSLSDEKKRRLYGIENWDEFKAGKTMLDEEMDLRKRDAQKSLTKKESAAEREKLAPPSTTTGSDRERIDRDRSDREERLDDKD